MPTTIFDPDTEIFEGKTPLIKLFIKFEKTRSSRQMKPYYHYYYHKSLTEWRSLDKATRRFLINLVRHNWQRCLNYLLEYTIVGSLRYELRDGKTDIRLVYMNEKRKQKIKQSKSHFSFSFHLAFHVKMKTTIHAIRRLLDLFPYITENMEEFLAYAEKKKKEEERVKEKLGRKKKK
ncbi:MAG: hypothetical protein LUH10_15175 [Tannerellaceae bacterium]|nr:hypothetical protein [Tannerellaceae bacterium]